MLCFAKHLKVKKTGYSAKQIYFLPNSYTDKKKLFLLNTRKSQTNLSFAKHFCKSKKKLKFSPKKCTNQQNKSVLQKIVQHIFSRFAKQIFNKNKFTTENEFTTKNEFTNVETNFHFVECKFANKRQVYKFGFSFVKVFWCKMYIFFNFKRIFQKVTFFFF